MALFGSCRPDLLPSKERKSREKAVFAQHEDDGQRGPGGSAQDRPVRRQVKVQINAPEGKASKRYCSR
jgi:hypothetical protein